MLTLKVVDDVDVGVNTHEVEVPAFEKSPATIDAAFMDFEKVKVKVIAEEVFVGVLWVEVKEEIVGAVRSIVIPVVAVAALAGPEFVASSLTALASNCG